MTELVRVCFKLYSSICAYFHSVVRVELDALRWQRCFSLFCEWGRQIFGVVDVCFPDVFSYLCLHFQDQDKEYIGFETLPNQVYRKSVKKGFDFTLMVAGKSSSSH